MSQLAVVPPFLGIDPGENLTETLGRYAEQVAAAQRILQEVSINLEETPVYSNKSALK